MKNQTTEYRNKFGTLIAVSDRESGFEYGSIIGEYNFDRLHCNCLTDLSLCNKFDFFMEGICYEIYDAERYEEVMSLEKLLNTLYLKILTCKKKLSELNDSNKDSLQQELLNLEKEYLNNELKLDSLV
jgi:hypothetical protein